MVSRISIGSSGESCAAAGGQTIHPNNGTRTDPRAVNTEVMLVEFSGPARSFAEDDF